PPTEVTPAAARTTDAKHRGHIGHLLSIYLDDGRGGTISTGSAASIGKKPLHRGIRRQRDRPIVRAPRLRGPPRLREEMGAHRPVGPRGQQIGPTRAPTQPSHGP